MSESAVPGCARKQPVPWPYQAPHRERSRSRQSTDTQADDGSSLVSDYFELGYTAICNMLIDHWMATMSGTEFKLVILFLRHTIGQQAKRTSGELSLGMTLTDIEERTGADRESVIRATRQLEEKQIISAHRARRKATRYTIDLQVLLRPSERRPDANRPVQVGKADSKYPFRSEKPTPNSQLKSGKPTPYKEERKLNKTAAAVAAGSSAPTHRTDLPEDLSATEWAEIRAMEKHVGVQIDGVNALAFKAAAGRASLTLAHFRWFVERESFSGARNRMAVLVSIAKEFRERSQGIAWPADFNGIQPNTGRGLTREEILQL